MTDPIRDALDAFAAIPAERPARRPDRATVERLLDMSGRSVQVTDHTITEDVDGLPSGISTATTEATIATNLSSLGWPRTEWDDPTITE